VRYVTDILKGILWDLAVINSEGSETPTGPRKYDTACSLPRIKISVARAYQEQKRAKGKNFRWDSGEVIPSVLEENKIYLESLVLVRHLRIEA
jgi:hypothetical protein